MAGEQPEPSQTADQAGEQTLLSSRIAEDFEYTFAKWILITAVAGIHIALFINVI